MMTDESATLAAVERMQRGWEDASTEAIMAAFTADATFQSMMEAPQNMAQMRAMLGLFYDKVSAVRWEILNRLVVGNIVVLERRDHFTFAGKPCVLPTVGVFEVQGERIAAWREYFDWRTYDRQVM